MVTAQGNGLAPRPSLDTSLGQERPLPPVSQVTAEREARGQGKGEEPGGVDGARDRALTRGDEECLALLEGALVASVHLVGKEHFAVVRGRLPALVQGDVG